MPCAVWRRWPIKDDFEDYHHPTPHFLIPAFVYPFSKKKKERERERERRERERKITFSFLNGYYIYYRNTSLPFHLSLFSLSLFLPPPPLFPLISLYLAPYSQVRLIRYFFFNFTCRSYYTTSTSITIFPRLLQTFHNLINRSGQYSKVNGKPHNRNYPLTIDSPAQVSCLLYWKEIIEIHLRHLVGQSKERTCYISFPC